ncbi:MAG: NAD+ synthase [bacterium]
MDGLLIDTKKVQKKLMDFIKQEVGGRGFKNTIIGLSGGLDSSVVAYLAAGALGKEHVWGIMMPYKTNSASALDHGRMVIDNLGINSDTVEITPMVDKYFESFPQADHMRRGNKMARERMSILYDLSALNKALVIGTSNKSELLLGYGTLHGDVACALNPLGGLYKTQVRQLATEIGVPGCIIEKAPSAGLWEGQEDEKELGFGYAEVDKLLQLMVDNKMSSEGLLSKGFDKSFIKTVRDKIKGSQYKREPAPIAEIS